MAKSIKSLSERLRVNSRPLTYAEYLEEVGVDPREELYGGITSASRDRATGSAGYGASGESLASRGLLGSGYAAYVDRQAREGYEKRLKTLQDRRESTARQTRVDYEGYLSDYERSQTTLAGSVKKRLEESALTDRQALLALARELGADDSHAKALADSAYRTNKEDALTRLLPQVLSLGVDAKRARELGLRLGLDEEAATELSEMVRFHNGGYEGYADKYLEYLEQIGSLTKYSTLTGEEPS